MAMLSLFITMAGRFLTEKMCVLLQKNEALLSHLINERGIKEETISVFDVGFYSSALNLLPEVFHRRIIFPHKDVWGDAIAVHARTTTGKKPKWINTVYPKISHLYGLYENYKQIVDLNFAIVVEGAIDVCVLYSHGIRNAVAMNSSSFSKNQAWLLANFCTQAVVVYDGDKDYGDIKEPFFPGNVDVMVLPPDEDPDTYVMKHGKEAFLDYLKRPNQIDTLKRRIQWMKDR